MNSEKKELSILVVGKSGAGKSEFIGSFANSNKQINSSGMGQTTRTCIEYNFYINTDIVPSVQIKMLTEDEFVDKRMKQIEKVKIPVNKYDLSIKDQVLDIEGFFNYREFDFDKNYSEKIDKLWDECFVSEIEKDNLTKEEYENFKNKVKNSLTNIIDNSIESNDFFNNTFRNEKSNYELDDFVEVMLHAVYKICKQSVIEYPEKFELNNLSDLNNKQLTYCLKVDEQNHSVTGLIAKVIINDKISNKYESIFKNLNVEKITFIDTYGLDHDETITEDILRNRYKILFNEYPEIETVFFVRALGSDAPTDLAVSIPSIYATNPAAVPYMVFTKIDENSIISGLSDKSKTSRTNGANRKRLENGELGYDGTYSDSWSSKFYLAYNEVFSKISDDDFEKYFKINANTNERVAIQELLNRFSKYLLGCDKNKKRYRFINKSRCSSCNHEKGCLKTIIVNSNPKYDKATNKFNCNKTPVYSWLTEVYDFNAYFNKVSNDIFNIFMRKFNSDFISECREHNARIVADNIETKEVNCCKAQEENTCFTEYYDKYDNIQDLQLRNEFERKSRSFYRI